MKKWIKDTAYNFDRTLASTFLDVGPQETISSTMGRNTNKWWGKYGCKCLDAAFPNHCAKAVQHANSLDKADNGFEG